MQKRLDWHFVVDSGQQKNIAATIEMLHKAICGQPATLQIEQKPTE